MQGPLSEYPKARLSVFCGHPAGKWSFLSADINTNVRKNEGTHLPPATHDRILNVLLTETDRAVSHPPLHGCAVQAIAIWVGSSAGFGLKLHTNALFYRHPRPSRTLVGIEFFSFISPLATHIESMSEGAGGRAGGSSSQIRWIAQLAVLTFWISKAGVFARLVRGNTLKEFKNANANYHRGEGTSHSQKTAERTLAFDDDADDEYFSRRLPIDNLQIDHMWSSLSHGAQVVDDFSRLENGLAWSIKKLGNFESLHLKNSADSQDLADLKELPYLKSATGEASKLVAGLQWIILQDNHHQFGELEDSFRDTQLSPGLRRTFESTLAWVQPQVIVDPGQVQYQLTQAQEELERLRLTHLGDVIQLASGQDAQMRARTLEDNSQVFHILGAEHAKNEPFDSEYTSHYASTQSPQALEGPLDPRVADVLFHLHYLFWYALKWQNIVHSKDIHTYVTSLFFTFTLLFKYQLASHDALRIYFQKIAPSLADLAWRCKQIEREFYYKNSPGILNHWNDIVQVFSKEDLQEGEDTTRAYFRSLKKSKPQPQKQPVHHEQPVSQEPPGPQEQPVHDEQPEPEKQRVQYWKHDDDDDEELLRRELAASRKKGVSKLWAWGKSTSKSKSKSTS